MNNKKCPNCGFINFVDAEACRKCETSLNSFEETYTEPSGYRPGFGANRYELAPVKSKTPVFKILGIMFLVGVASVIGLAIMSIKASIKWEKVKPAGSDLAFWMPGSNTTIDSDSTPTAIGTMTRKVTVSVVPNQGSAMLAIADFSNGFSLDNEQAETALNAELSNVLQATKSYLVSKQFTTVQGLKALEFEVTPRDPSPTNPSKGYGKLILSDGRLYCLLLTANVDSSLIQQKDKFLNPEKVYDAPARLKMPKIEPFKPMQPYQPPQQ